MINPADLDKRLQLYTCDQIGPQSYKQLIKHFGSAELSLLASEHDLQACGLNTIQINAIKTSSAAKADAILHWLQVSENNVLCSDQRNFPQALQQIDAPPPLLFCKGDTDLLNEPQIAIVGSRNASGAGKQIAYDFAQSLSKRGITITSGLAAGIDAQAHHGALSHASTSKLGKTIAVVATGLDRVYPASNKSLAEQIAAQGLLISEFNLGQKPHAGHFPRRNRLISGLSLGTLVVEATIKSGSLITTKHALEQGKEIFAIPGSIHNPMSKGCHQLIRQGAKLVETVDDIVLELHEKLRSYLYNSPNNTLPAVASRDNKNKSTTPKLNNDQRDVLKAIDYEPTTIDEIIQRTGFSSDAVSSILLILELNDCICADKGGFRRIK